MKIKIHEDEIIWKIKIFENEFKEKSKIRKKKRTKKKKILKNFRIIFIDKLIVKIQYWLCEKFHMEISRPAAEEDLNESPGSVQ